MEQDKEKQPKSRQQEESYHVLFGQIADYCIANGINIKTVVDKLETDAKFVKSVWVAILHSKTGKTRTRDQTKEDIKLVQPEFTVFWEELTGQRFDWPSIETQMFNALDESKYQ